MEHLSNEQTILSLPFSYDVFRREMGEVALKSGEVVSTVFGKLTKSELDLALSILYEMKGTIDRVIKQLESIR